MELVGTEIRKNFEGFGVFTGTVQSYDAAAGYFRIQYEDGDSEEVDFEEMESILGDMVRSSSNLEHHAQRSKRGRPPKKRRRLEPDPSARRGTVIDFENGGERSGLDETLAAENGHLEASQEIQANVGCNGDEGRRKRPRSSGKEKPTPEKPLRRSARKTSMPAKFENALVSQDEDLGGGRKRSVPVLKNSILIKPQLPPSSKDLDLDDLNAFDLFSVYTCLRSFSRLLFLSPFTLEAFVAALRCNHPTLIIDSIHFSILEALKPHLESLSEEGSQSASDCLRYLNWEFLDVVTWPVFLVYYLVIHGSGMKPGFRLGQLKLLDSEYYEQPAGVKLEILRCLCDDVIEISAIRSELNRRMDTEMNVDTSYINMDIERKRKSSGPVDPSVNEGLEETDDGNIDECCLCGMDGSLICCDGCPAAFHSRCVGVAKDFLPEGDWYCPECLVEKTDGLAKLSMPFRGAELLGTDPHGRLYFGSCNRLLVSDSCHLDASFHYYAKDDLGSVITALKPCYAYNPIINAISMYWGFPVDAFPSNNQSGNDIFDDLKEGLVTELSEPPLPSKIDVLSVENAEVPAVENSASSEECVRRSSYCSDLAHLNLVAAYEPVEMGCPFSRSEPFDENVHASSCMQQPQQTGPDCLMGSPSMHGAFLKRTDVTIASEKYIGLPGGGLIADRKKAESLGLHSDPSNYINYYCFGRLASSISAELMRKSSERNNNESKNPIEDIKAAQLTTISRMSTKGYCYAYQKLYVNVRKENCGWCLSCRTSSDLECLFKVAAKKNLKGFKNKDIDGSEDKDLEAFKNNNIEDAKRQTFGDLSLENKNSHIFSVVHHILSIEGHAGSLLSGPWEKPHYRQQWRKAVMKADNVASLRPLLLSLELSLRRVALSAEWSRQVDDAYAIVSSSLVTGPIRGSSSYVGSRKQGKKNIVGDELSRISRRAAISDIYWWRGGRLSRQVFQCKILPQALASKGGRQAGCKKISNILYPDGLDIAKRCKYVAWRVAVEMSKSVAQLMYQSKDFDSNIKWADISGTLLFPKLAKDSKNLGKDSKKMARRWKNVTICGKCNKGKQVRYLLDFGKREAVPPIVTKHGLLIEESTAARKRYWLPEAYVPLYLLKSYEEKKMKKKIARLLKKADKGARHAKESKCEIKKRKRSEWLSYLVSKEQRSREHLCGHCNKYVTIREAVNCHLCHGLFHRKHFRVPKGAITTIYLCNKCRDTEALSPKDNDTKSVKAKNKDSKSVKARDRDSKKVKAKKKNINNINITDRAVTSVDVKTKGTKSVKAKKNIKSKMLRDDGQKSVDVEDNLRRSKRVRQKDQSNVKWRPQKLKIILRGAKVSEDKDLLATPKKGKRLLLKHTKRYTSHKGGKKCKSASALSEYIDNGISWHKRKRSSVHSSYWLNGLLWTRKSLTEQQGGFKEKSIILPFQSTASSMKPLCSLCHREYNLGVIYICCESCQDWFHGDAFSLNVESVNNLIGFRCHKCRKRSGPICPFSGSTFVGDAVATERKIGVNIAYNVNQNDGETEDIVSNDHQDDEDKACSSPRVCKGNHWDDKHGDGACIDHQDKEKDHGNSQEDVYSVVQNEVHMDELQSKDVAEDIPGLSSEVTLISSVDLQHKNNLENSGDIGHEDCSIAIRQDYKNDKRADDVIVFRKEPVLSLNTLSTTLDNVQSPQQVETDIASTKNENELEIGLALHGMREGLYRVSEVCDSVPLVGDAQSAFGVGCTYNSAGCKSE